MKHSFRSAAVLASITILIILGLSARAGAQTAPEPIRLEVDASRAPQKILHTHEQIPVRPGPLVLLITRSGFRASTCRMVRLATWLV